MRISDSWRHFMIYRCLSVYCTNPRKQWGNPPPNTKPIIFNSKKRFQDRTDDLASTNRALWKFISTQHAHIAVMDHFPCLPTYVNPRTWFINDFGGGPSMATALVENSKAHDYFQAFYNRFWTSDRWKWDWWLTICRSRWFYVQCIFDNALFKGMYVRNTMWGRPAPLCATEDGHVWSGMWETLIPLEMSRFRWSPWEIILNPDGSCINSGSLLQNKAVSIYAW